MVSPASPPPSAAIEEEIDFADIFRSLRRQWWKIVIVAAVITAFAIYRVLSSSPQFTVTAAVYLGNLTTGEPAGALGSGQNFLTDFAAVSDVDTQVALLQSTSLLTEAIEETGINASIEPYGHHRLSYWRWRYVYGQSVNAYAPQPGDLRVVDATIADPGTGGVGYTVIFGQNGSFRLVAGGGLFSSPYTVLTGVIDRPASGAGIAFMIKPAIAGAIPPAGSRYKLGIGQASSLAQLFAAPKPLSVAAGGTASTQTNIANLAFVWNDPFQAQAFLTHLMNDFIATQLSWKTQSATATEAFVSQQLDKISASLSNANKNLAAYQSRTGILDVTGNAQAVITQVAANQSQQAQIELQQEALKQLSVEMSHPDGDINPYLVSQSGDSALGPLANQLAMDEVTLQGDRVQFTSNAPEIQALQAQISAIERSMATIVANDEKSAARSLKNITAQIARYKDEMKDMPSEGLQVTALTQASTVYGQIYVLLMQKEEEAVVSKAAAIVDTRVVSPPIIPLGSTAPKAPLIIISGLFLGLVAGIGLVLAQRAVSGSFQTDEDVRRTIALPVYGLIPRLSRREVAHGILSARPKGPFPEAFRLLRNHLYQAAAQQAKIILVTSASSDDGKTTIAANLAKFLADDGRRVALVDGDLHRGRAHEFLQAKPAPGLTEWLVANARPPLQLVAGQRFVLLPAGKFPPNSSELLNEGRLREIFTALRAEFDYIIVDCPPLPAVADTLVFGQLADVILSVVHLDHTARRAFILHNQTLAMLDTRRGVVINGIIGAAYDYGHEYGQDEPPTAIGRIRKSVTNFAKRLS